jgi:hypothetical protein
MLNMIFTIGGAISAGLFIYGAFIAIDYALFPKNTTRKAEEAPAKAGELPEMGYDW